MEDQHDDGKAMELESPAVPSAIDTYENIPATVFYRSFGIKRASPVDIRTNADSVDNNLMPVTKSKKGANFGWFDGVYLRCVLNIISVVYYLRLGWVVGNCGLLLTYVMIIVSALADIFTTLSLSAIVTNGTIKGGGVYYCISRSLGPDFGGTIGVVFSLATLFTVILNVFGFEETLEMILPHPITTDGKWDIEIIGIALATVAFILICISLAFESVMQWCLFIVIIISVVLVFIGFAIPKTPSWKVSNIKANLYPKYQKGESFFTIFAIYFPACTGIMAGANISGDLKDPNHAIPLGTLLAIITTTVVYLITATILASAADQSTLVNNYGLLAEVSAWKWIIYIGLLCASFSSVSSAMVGAPKTFQALCKDKILPKIFDIFAWGKKKSGDPIWGFLLAYILTVISTFVFKNLNAIGPVISSLFLISYGIVSFSSLVCKLSHAPSWRPSWKYYHPITAVLGAIMCFASVFLINWIICLVSFIVVGIIFGYFHWHDSSNSKWGEYPQSILFSDTISRIDKLNQFAPHVKNYRPIFEFLIERDGTEKKQLQNALPFNDAAEVSSSILFLSSYGVDNPQEITKPDFFAATVLFKNWRTIGIEKIPALISSTGVGKITSNVLCTSITQKFLKNPKSFEFVGSAFDSYLGVCLARNFETVDQSLEQTWPIDVWWLVDDGGLTVLLGFLIQMQESWKNCPLRVLSVTERTESLNEIQVKITKLMHLFRINAEVIVLNGIEDKPSQESMDKWKALNINNCDEMTMKKVETFLRLRDLIFKTSAQSSMILCSMPIPRATQDPNVWLGTIDVVSESMPPFIWVHGNGENVVTYSA